MQRRDAGADELTGNDYVGIPQIRPDAALDAVNVLHAGLGGLVEWRGADGPLLRPVIDVGGSAVTLEGLRWRRLDRWIPTFALELPGPIRIQGTICAPGGYPPARGFLVRLEVENGGRAAIDVGVGLEVDWGFTGLRIATVRSLTGANRIVLEPDTGTIALESDGGRGPALAIRTSGQQPQVMEGPALPPGTVLEGRQERSAGHGTALRATLREVVRAVPNRRTAVSFFVGAARERDGAVAAAEALRRAGAEHWLRQARLELSYMLRSGGDHRWSDLLNRNLIFNRYFATARAIDDDRLYLLRSRSPLCPEPALFNEREALFWTLPALVLADPGIAREALLRVFELFSERSGEFRRYVDGAAFDPAFALDQLLLYTWAADHYATAAGDPGIVDEPLTRQVIFESDATLFTRLHPQFVLCSTEVLPSGDRADHAYTTFANALLRSFCESLPRLLPAGGDEQPPRLAGAAAEVSAAIWQHCVADLQGTPVFASSADLDGGSAIYDDPAGSLALLPFFGFCPSDDPVWSATMEFLRSPAYPLWREGPVPGLAERSRPDHCSLAGLCADLLGPVAPEALDRLLRLHLPGNLAAAGWNATTAAAEGPHHAALAGFLAWSLVRAAEPPAERRNRGRRR